MFNWFKKLFFNNSQVKTSEKTVWCGIDTCDSCKEIKPNMTTEHIYPPDCTFTFCNDCIKAGKGDKMIYAAMEHHSIERNLLRKIIEIDKSLDCSVIKRNKIRECVISLNEHEQWIATEEEIENRVDYFINVWLK